MDYLDTEDQLRCRQYDVAALKLPRQGAGDAAFIAAILAQLQRVFRFRTSPAQQFPVLQVYYASLLEEAALVLPGRVTDKARTAQLRQTASGWLLSNVRQQVERREVPLPQVKDAYLRRSPLNPDIVDEVRSLALRPIDMHQLQARASTAPFNRPDFLRRMEHAPYPD